MADAPWPARPDLTDLPPAIEAFELLRRLQTAERRFGHTGGATTEPARLGQAIRLGPAPCETDGWDAPGGNDPARVALNIIGLFGPEGPMPLHLSRRMFQRMSERWYASAGADAPGADRSFLEFCNLLQHRMIALYFRAFAEAQPAVAADHGGGRFAVMLAALAGSGLPGVAAAMDDPDLLLRHATDLADTPRSPERLAALLSDLLAAPVRLVEFVPYWQAMPTALESRLGRVHAQLGAGAMIGPRVYQPQCRARIQVGPLALPQYRALMQDGPALTALRRLLRFVMGDEIGFDLQLLLNRAAVPAPELGRCIALGRLGWLPGGPDADRDDLVLPLDERQAA